MTSLKYLRIDQGNNLFFQSIENIQFRIIQRVDNKVTNFVFVTLKD